MRKAAAFGLVTFAAIASGLAPALADQSVASRILFGRIYNDRVAAIQVTSVSLHHDRDLPQSVIEATPSSRRAAQAKARQDRQILQALSVREIALKNVIQVDTALNGGRIIYYR